MSRHKWNILRALAAAAAWILPMSQLMNPVAAAGAVTRGWLTLTLRKRVFGGFAVILALLVALAGVALQGLASVGAGAGRVSQDSARAAASAEIALLVEDARALVVRYALSGTMDDQHAMQAALARLDQAIAGGSATDSGLQERATRYRGKVDASIAAVEARRSSIEQMQVAATEVRTIVSASTQVLDHETDLTVVAAVARLAESFGAADSASARFAAGRTPAEANAAVTAAQAVPGAIEALRTAAAENRRIQRFVKGMADPLDRFGKALKLLVATSDQVLTAAAEREAASAEVLRVAAEQRARSEGSQQEAIAAMLAGTDSARRLGLLTSISAIAIGLLLAGLIGHGIARPIGQLTDTMHALADGSLDIEIPNATRRDELGEMARAVVVFKENAKAVLRLQQEQEQQRRRADADKRAALETMADTIESETGASLEHIRDQTGSMTAMADAMSASAGRTGASAATVGEAAGQAMTNAQAVAGAAEQLTASIREIGTQMSHSAGVVAQAVSAGTETRATIETLREDVERIGVVADMIREIAAKTNLLALNATIEAARAGDAGKGFAVVASEVKALATQTGRSTEEIAKHINQVRATTEASVAAVARIEATITEVNTITGSIAAAVEQQGAATAEIGRNVSETAHAADKMAVRASEVSAEASETARQAAEVRTTCSGLNDAMEALRRSVVDIARKSTVEVDRRDTNRYQVDLNCQLKIAGQPYRATVVNLSEGGAQVSGGPALLSAIEGTLSMAGADYELPFVVRRSQDGMLGLGFMLDKATQERLDATLEELQKRRAA